MVEYKTYYIEKAEGLKMETIVIRYIEVTSANGSKVYHKIEEEGENEVKRNIKRFEDGDLYLRWCQKEEIILNNRRFVEDNYRYLSEKIYIGRLISEKIVSQKVHTELANYWFAKNYSDYILLADGRVKPIKPEQREGKDYIIR